MNKKTEKKKYLKLKKQINDHYKFKANRNYMALNLDSEKYSSIVESE